jgi:hypothetical protein
MQYFPVLCHVTRFKGEALNAERAVVEAKVEMNTGRNTCGGPRSVVAGIGPGRDGARLSRNSGTGREWWRATPRRGRVASEVLI